MQVYILHCPALGNATPNLMRKLSAIIFDDRNAALYYLNETLDTTFELYSPDAFRELWNSPLCATLFPDASFIATIFVRQETTEV